MRVSEIKQVNIHLQTTVSNEQEQETFELLTFGTLQNKGETLYLRYEEVQEDLQKTQSIVKWSAEEVFIMRSGHIKMRQRFIKDMMTTSVYESPFGALQMLTTAKSMNHVWDEKAKEGKMILIYDLNMQGNDVGEYKMEITYKEDAK